MKIQVIEILVTLIILIILEAGYVDVAFCMCLLLQTGYFRAISQHIESKA